MLTSLALIFLVGLALAALCQKLKLPRIIGMLLTGILIGPYVLNWLDDSILSISSELRQMALIIILIKAGLSLDLSDLKKVGRPAVMMACVPASCEILAFFLLAPHILGINRIEAAVMGAVLGAVSPAVVVPRMVQLMEEKRGTGQGIPQMILAGASCDDIYVIVLFSTFVGMAQGGIQSLSRSYYGRIIPKNESNEYFGFFDIFGKFADFFGPLIVSFCAFVFGTSTYGILALLVLFVIGYLLLRKVPEA